jgi:hypothetical protein
MFTKFLLTCLSVPRQVNLIRNRGIMLGTRTKDGRQVYIYMYRNLFAEILYRNDNPEGTVENVIVIPGFRKLNAYFEKEVKTAK